METIELTWIRPTQRTAVRFSIEIDDLRQASELFGLALALLQPPSGGQKPLGRGPWRRRPLSSTRPRTSGSTATSLGGTP